MLLPLLRIMSPPGARARLSVLIFHRVLPAPDPLFPQEMHATRFSEICGWLRNMFNVLPLDEAAQRLQAGTLPSRAAAVTFDDGYADNCQVAMPILKRHQLTAAFFVSTGFIDGGCMWNDVVIEAVRQTRRSSLQLEDVLGQRFAHVQVESSEDKRDAISAMIGHLKYLPVAARLECVGQLASKAEVTPPTDLMMTSDELRTLHRAGMQIGAHTVSHPILATLDRTSATREISEGKMVLEKILGDRVRLFAYPNGKPSVDYTPESVAIVRELGFDAACSTHWAAATADTDVFQIPRFTPWDHTEFRFGARLLGNLVSSNFGTPAKGVGEG
jgi:peptidoglycan/xylan/chitin deacetylase (PgdA/CDA1 family)